jgi:hypothetical protein
MHSPRLRRTALALASVAVAASALVITASAVRAQDGPSGNAMILYGHAPTLEFGDDSYSGGGIVLAADVLVGNRWVGRAQVDLLQASSLDGPDAERVRGGLAFIGSLGYRFRFPTLPKLSLDLLGHAGYAQVTYNNGNADFTDASPQVGIGIAPHWAMSDRFGLTFAVRTLKGSAVGEGTAIHRTDLGIGGRLALF